MCGYKKIADGVCLLFCGREKGKTSLAIRFKACKVFPISVTERLRKCYRNVHPFFSTKIVSAQSIPFSRLLSRFALP